MSRIIKLKQSDIVRIVENVLGDNLDTEYKDFTDQDMGEQDVPTDESKLGVGMDKNGVYYIINKETGQVLAKK